MLVKNVEFAVVQNPAGVESVKSTQEEPMTSCNKDTLSLHHRDVPKPTGTMKGLSKRLDTKKVKLDNKVKDTADLLPAAGGNINSSNKHG